MPTRILDFGCSPGEAAGYGGDYPAVADVLDQRRQSPV